MAETVPLNSLYFMLAALLLFALQHRALLLDRLPRQPYTLLVAAGLAITPGIL